MHRVIALVNPRFWLACKGSLWLVARDGVEPSTFRFSVGRSYQLSYLAVVVLQKDTEPRVGPWVWVQPPDSRRVPHSTAVSTSTSMSDSVVRKLTMHGRRQA